jgi:uncharacterized UBP type Zn finger protein
MNHYKDNKPEAENQVDVALHAVYMSKGAAGLKELYGSIRTTYMPAGLNIGDSHELIVHMCDKLPWLDKAFRFEIGDRIECSHCKDVQVKTDTTIDLHLMPSKPRIPLLQAIQEYIQPHTIADWKCEKCNKLGCTKQVMFGGFPKTLMIWSSTPVEYSSVVVINSKPYVLFGVVCFNGGHWKTYARKLPPGNPWTVLDDQTVMSMDARKFPLDTTMRVLLYFLTEN